MCLTKLIKEPVPPNGVGYKVFWKNQITKSRCCDTYTFLYEKTRVLMSHKELSIGETVENPHVVELRTDKNEPYPSGFHIFLSASDAFKYRSENYIGDAIVGQPTSKKSRLSIVKVEFEQGKAIGVRSLIYGDCSKLVCVVADKMTILDEIKACV